MGISLDADGVAALFTQPGDKGRFEGRIAEYLRKLGKRRPAILLCYPPKAGGTFFRTAVITAIDGQLVRIAHALGGRDTTPYLPTFIEYYLGGVCTRRLVAHVHMLALAANRNFIEAFDIKPIVMTRSIPDMLASYWDMLEQDPVSRDYGLNCAIPSNFLDMTSDTKADFLVDILGPWYANFFATWYAYAEEDPSRVCILSYSDLRSDPVGTLETALRHVGQARSRDHCRKAMDEVWREKEQFRFNQGIEGRGAYYFQDRHIARLSAMLSYYPNLQPHHDELLSLGAYREALRPTGTI